MVFKIIPMGTMIELRLENLAVDWGKNEFRCFSFHA